jgi:hypothetical protein
MVAFEAPLGIVRQFAPLRWVLRRRFSSAAARYLRERGASSPSRREMRDFLAVTESSEIATAARSLLADENSLSLLTNQPAMLRRGNYAERLAFYVLSRCLHRQSWQERTALLQGLEKVRTPLAGSELTGARGFVLVDGSGWNVVQDAIAEANGCFEAAPNEHVNPGKVSMRTAPAPPSIMTSRLMALARHPALLRFVGDYLGGLPILMRINLLRSDNDELQDGSSQFYHIDPEDFRQVKLFLLVRDVDDDTGPLHLVGARESELIQLGTNYRLANPRLTDVQVDANGGAGAVVRCTGRAGTMVFADTSRCFHMGSRPGAKKRYVAMFQYVTPSASAFPLDGDEISTKYGTLAKNEAGKEALADMLFGVRR